MRTLKLNPPTKALLLAMVFGPQAAIAGPPFLTDDPEPTETGHWEIYAPFVEFEGDSQALGGSTGVEFNYGAARDLQITVGLPVDFTHEDQGTTSGFGDLRLSAKYRFYNDEVTGIQVALFPGLTFPSGTNGMGAGRVTAFFPLWAQKDYGPWSIFGGGGYAINPGAGNRNCWSGSVAVTRKFDDRLTLGVEAKRQGADTVDGQASTSLGFGGIYRAEAPFRVLAPGGPTFLDRGGPTAFHAYMALGLDF